MRLELSENERKVLREIQRQNNKRDYVKATIQLMLDLGETPQKIAICLGIDDGTVYRQAEKYQTVGLDKYLGHNYYGYWGKLDSFQIAELRTELKEQLYETCQEIRELIKQRFSVTYTSEGVCDLLNRIGFVYKKTKQIAIKVDEVAQAEFIEQFEQLQATRSEDEVHYFIDAVHPTMNSEASYGWIEKGEEHQIRSNSGRTRINLLGALNPNEITDIISKEYKTIDS